MKEKYIFFILYFYIKFFISNILVSEFVTPETLDGKYCTGTSVHSNCAEEFNHMNVWWC